MGPICYGLQRKLTKFLICEKCLVNIVWLKQCVSNYYCGILSTTNTSLQWKTIAHEFYLHSCTVRQVLSFYFLFGFSCWKELSLWWGELLAVQRKWFWNPGTLRWSISSCICLDIFWQWSLLTMIFYPWNEVRLKKKNQCIFS